MDKILEYKREHINSISLCGIEYLRDTLEIDSETVKYTDVEVNIPCTCPSCNGILPRNTYPLISLLYDFDTIEAPFTNVALYSCPNCNESIILIEDIILTYRGTSTKDKDGYFMSTGIRDMFPKYSTSKTINTKEINELSPSFIKIYSQAEKAEEQGLNEICGMGYRKALEFLVEDYIKYLYKDIDLDRLRNLSLKQRIKEYIKNEEIYTLANGARILGNDYTHIVNTHSEIDINTMKQIIEALVYYIRYKLTVDKTSTIKEAKRST